MSVKRPRKSAGSTKRRRFQDIALKHFSGDIPIDVMRERCLQEGFWGTSDYESFAIRAMNAEIRQHARTRFVDDSGIHRELVNVVRFSDGPNEAQQCFVWVHEASEPDLKWVIMDRIKKSRYFDEEASRFLKTYAERFGEEAARLLQGQLGFGDDGAQEVD